MLDSLKPAAAANIFDPATPLEDAVVVAKKMMHIDPLFDVRIASKLRKLAETGVTDTRALEWGLHILDAISPGTRIVFALNRLMGSADKRLRPIAAFVLAKRVQNLKKWADTYLHEHDPQVRANIIQALWEADSPIIPALLRRAADDPHHRVAPNAVLGLYKRKESDAAAFVVLANSDLTDNLRFASHGSIAGRAGVYRPCWLAFGLVFGAVRRSSLKFLRFATRSECFSARASARN
ncbi:MAG: HEAT repeat domain-containing protein [Bryobacteraceae bacterium]